MAVSDRAAGKTQENKLMPIDKLIQHPALKPTILAQDVLENVYRPTRPDMQNGEEVSAPVARQTPTRERHRAA